MQRKEKNNRMGKTRDLFKKITDTKGTFPAKMSTMKDRNGMDLKESESRLFMSNSMDYAVHGILQARILEWVAFPLSRGSSQPRGRTQVSCIAGRFFTS